MVSHSVSYIDARHESESDLKFFLVELFQGHGEWKEKMYNGSWVKGVNAGGSEHGSRNGENLRLFHSDKQP